MNLEPAIAPTLGPDSLTALESVAVELRDSAKGILQDNFVGAYLVGSFALGAGDDDSDVDFIVVTADVIDSRQQAALRIRHAAFPDEPVTWARHLEGSYVPANALRRPSRPAGRWLYVDNGSRDMEWSPHDDTAVLRWVMRAFGIMLAGPDPMSLIDPVPASDIRQESMAAIERWAGQLVDAHIDVDSAWEQQHVVLAVCRCLYSAVTGEVTSKIGAGSWALANVAVPWRPLIERAILDRPHPWERVHQPADSALVPVTANFVAYARLLVRGAIGW